MKDNPQDPGLQGNRRPTRKVAKTAATMLARHAYGRDSAGKLIRVKDPKAQKVLARAFWQLIMHDRKPFAMQITASEAAAFPSHTLVESGTYALAVGIDLQDRATFSTAGAAAVTDDEPVDATTIAETLALMGLQRGLQVPGIPQGMQP
ncbi:MAG: hypothetical protein ABGX10_15225 [Paracoccus sp. (in: a-proteobacteria)]|uniref:hypothetical protein n=1 Tax=Paracoccus sp. TaxID=267 RepID=UPI003242A990